MALGILHCNTRALLLWGMWDLSPQPGIKPASPALGGIFLTTGQPEKTCLPPCLVHNFHPSCLRMALWRCAPPIPETLLCTATPLPAPGQQFRPDLQPNPPLLFTLPSRPSADLEGKCAETWFVVVQGVAVGSLCHLQVRFIL